VTTADVQRFGRKLGLDAVGVAPASERPVLRDQETAGATDLLHAERAAKRVERRLKRPNTGIHGWVHGGSGWSPAAKVAEERSDVVINLGQRRRRPAPN